MPKMIGINVGFITNSSSCVHHFPKSLLDDPQVKAFLKAFEAEEGFVGPDMWTRSQCASFAVSKEQKEEIRQELNSKRDYPAPGIDMDESLVVIVYGDEHLGLALMICNMLKEAAARAGLQIGFGDEYN